MRSLALGAILAALVVVGCQGSNQGTLPPPAQPLTQEQLDKMPPQARSAAENASKAGEVERQRMEQMMRDKQKAGQ